MDGGREPRTLAGHTDIVNGVALSGDEELAVSASEDKTLKVWDVASGRELISLAAHEGEVNCVAWTPDGEMLLSGGVDGIQVYAMHVDLLMSLARSRVTRNLTPQECRKYLHHDDVPPIP